MTIDNQPATRRSGAHTGLESLGDLGLDGLDLVRLLDADGVRHSDDRFDAWVSDIGPEQLLDLYEDMRVIRRIDAEATALQRQGESAHPRRRG